MKSVALVAVSALALLAPGGCPKQDGGKPNPLHAIVCVAYVKGTVDSYQRIPDGVCEQGTHKWARWRYYGADVHIEPVDGHVPGRSGTWTRPEGDLVHMPVHETSWASKEFKKK